MASVSRVLETSGCGVQWRECHMKLISIIPGLMSPDIPCPVALQYSLYGYGCVLSLVQSGSLTPLESLVSLLCLATELSAEVPLARTR